MLLLVTDGNSNVPEETIKEALALKLMGVHIIAISVGGWINKRELDTIASWPASANSINVDNFEDLIDIISDMRDMVCNSKYFICIGGKVMTIVI